MWQTGSLLIAQGFHLDYRDYLQGYHKYSSLQLRFLVIIADSRCVGTKEARLLRFLAWHIGFLLMPCLCHLTHVAQCSTCLDRVSGCRVLHHWKVRLACYLIEWTYTYTFKFLIFLYSPQWINTNNLVNEYSTHLPLYREMRLSYYSSSIFLSSTQTVVRTISELHWVTNCYSKYSS